MISSTELTLIVTGLLTFLHFAVEQIGEYGDSENEETQKSVALKLRIWKHSLRKRASFLRKFEVAFFPFALTCGRSGTLYIGTGFPDFHESSISHVSTLDWLESVGNSSNLALAAG